MVGGCLLRVVHGMEYARGVCDGCFIAIAVAVAVNMVVNCLLVMLFLVPCSLFIVHWGYVM